MAAVSHDTDEVRFLENEGSERKRELRGNKRASKRRLEMKTERGGSKSISGRLRIVPRGAEKQGGKNWSPGSQNWMLGGLAKRTITGIYNQ